MIAARTPIEADAAALPPELGRLLRSVAADTRSVVALARVWSDGGDGRLGDKAFRAELCDRLRSATGRIGDSISRLERLAGASETIDLSALLARLLERRWEELMERDVLLIKQLEASVALDCPRPARLARAVDAVLTAVIAAVARGGDVHVAVEGIPSPGSGTRGGARVVLHFPVDRRIWDPRRLAETLEAAALLEALGGELALRVTTGRLATAFVTLSSEPRRL